MLPPESSVYTAELSGLFQVHYMGQHGKYLKHLFSLSALTALKDSFTNDPAVPNQNIFSNRSRFLDQISVGSEPHKYLWE